MTESSSLPRELDGLVTVVTGAAQGLGLGIVETLAGMGATVVIADLQLEKAEAAAQSLVNSGLSVSAARLPVAVVSSPPHANKTSDNAASKKYFIDISLQKTALKRGVQFGFARSEAIEIEAEEPRCVAE